MTTKHATHLTIQFIFFIYLLHSLSAMKKPATSISRLKFVASWYMPSQLPTSSQGAIMRNTSNIRLYP